MSDLTPERIAELRRIAEAATPGPWAWRMSKDGRILDLITLETGYNEEIITPSHINAWLQVKGGVKDFIPAFNPATALALLDRIEALEAKQQIGRNLSVAAEQLVKAWDMNAPCEDLQFLIDDLRQALFEFEGPLGYGEAAWLSVDDSGEAGGATHA